MLPKKWKGFSFKVLFRGEVKTLEVGARD